MVGEQDDSAFDFSPNASGQSKEHTYKTVFSDTQTRWSEQWDSFNAPVVVSKCVGFIAGVGNVGIELVREVKDSEIVGSVVSKIQEEKAMFYDTIGRHFRRGEQ